MVAQVRVAAAAAGAGKVGMTPIELERGATAVITPIRPTPDRPAGENVAAPVSEPEWRREVAERLESYRARRRRPRPLDDLAFQDDSQRFLALNRENAKAPPVETETTEETEAGNSHANANEAAETVHGLPVVQFAASQLVADPDEYTRRRAALRVAARPRRHDRLEITVSQPQFDFSVNEMQDLHPQDTARPVAELRERRLAGLVDGAILGLTCAGFFLLFRSLGGEVSFTRSGIASCLLSAYLVYAQYFVLFTVFLGVTPGMMLRGLEVLALDGRAPTTRHLVWRSFGYLLSSAAVFLGFLWALWDDDRLTWQDRISQTYVTPAAELASKELVASPQES